MSFVRCITVYEPDDKNRNFQHNITDISYESYHRRWKVFDTRSKIENYRLDIHLSLHFLGAKTKYKPFCPLFTHSFFYLRLSEAAKNVFFRATKALPL